MDRLDLLESQWDCENNTKDFKSVSQGNKYKAFWICEKRHRWQAIFSNRINGKNCPYCSNKKVCEDNCLAFTHPELIQQWHPTKNGILTPFDITYGSEIKAWWICSQNHMWEIAVNCRTSKGSNCPYCCGQKVNSSNCLDATHPNIAKEWHPTKNGNLTPFNVGHGCNKKVWWKCNRALDHEWEFAIGNRARVKFSVGCPFCSNRKLSKSNSLAVLRPDLAKQWDTTKNGILTPFNFTIKSIEKIWWKCDVAEDHEWITSIHSRAKGRNCPCCTGQKLSITNCLATKFPEVARQWHPTKNGILTPFDILAKTSKKFWWICDKNHEYLASVAHRTSVDARGCPFCNESKGEKRVAEVLQKLKLNFEKQVKFESCKNKLKLPFDFMVKYLNKEFLIEYQGEQHYQPLVRSSKKTEEKKAIAILDLQNIKINDEIKRNWCKANNILLLEIPYWDFKKIEEIIFNSLYKFQG